MIDFRYHIVSLVAVFIALAVGIVLGAGPLREGISDTLENEVSQLREERSDLRAELDRRNAQVAGQNESLEQVAVRAAAGSLTNVRVAVVLLPGADRNQVLPVGEMVDAAGGSVAQVIEVRTAAEDPARQEGLSQLTEEFGTGDEELPERAPFPELLSWALTDAARSAELSRAETVPGADIPSTGIGATWAGAALLQRLADEGYVQLSGAVDTGAEVPGSSAPSAFVVLGGGPRFDADGELSEEDTALAEQRTELLAALGDHELPVVLAGTGAASDPDGMISPLLTAVREDGDIAGQVSTVDDLEGPGGRLAVVYALSWALSDEVDHFGLGEGASAPLPAPPPTRFSGPPEGEDAAATAPVEAP